MMNDGLDLTLTDAERLQILELATPAEFIEWQRGALAEWIERRVAMRAQTQAQEVVAEAVAKAQAAFPTLWPDAADGQPQP